MVSGILGPGLENMENVCNVDKGQAIGMKEEWRREHSRQRKGWRSTNKVHN